MDLLLVVRDVALLDAPAKVAAMNALSYQAMGEYGIVGRRFFSRYDEEGQPIHNAFMAEMIGRAAKWRSRI